MADDLGLGQYAESFKGIAGGTYDVLWYFAFFALLCVLVWFVWWWTRHNRLVLINFETRGGVKFFTSDMARKVHIKGAEYWKLRRLKKTWLAPPGSVVRITGKGKFCAECNYKEADDHPIWVQLEEGDIIDQEGAKINRAQANFAPEDKALLVEQLEEAENRKKNLLNTLLQLAPSIMIFLIFVCILVFWNNIWEPMKVSQEQMAVIAHEQAKTAENQGKIMLLQIRLIEALIQQRVIDPSSINIQQEIQANAELLGLNATKGG